MDSAQDDFIDEVLNTFNNKKGDTVECKQCKVKYKRGDWNFYNLCDSCFKEFDRKKMEERFKLLFGKKDE